MPVQRPTPTPGAGEVLIRVAAAGVNRPDVMQRQGLYPAAAGRALHSGAGDRGPDRRGRRGGGAGNAGPAGLRADRRRRLCRICLAVAEHCLPVPHGLSMVQAAAIPETLFTVWTNVFERAYADEGDTLLVHGGTSGIGTMAILLGVSSG